MGPSLIRMVRRPCLCSLWYAPARVVRRGAQGSVCCYGRDQLALRLWAHADRVWLCGIAALCEWHRVVPRIPVEQEDIMCVAAFLEAQHPFGHAVMGPPRQSLPLPFRELCTFVPGTQPVSRGGPWNPTAVAARVSSVSLIPTYDIQVSSRVAVSPSIAQSPDAWLKRPLSKPELVS